MSALEKLVDKLPIADGGFRRRFTAGGLVLVPPVVYALFFSSEKMLEIGVDAKTLSSSPVLAAAILVLIYALGNLVEAFGETFVARASGNLVWAVTLPWRKCTTKNKYLRFLTIAAALYILVPFAIYWELLKGLVGRSSYTWEALPKRLSPSARIRFRKLPRIVQTGFIRPFDNQSEVAWRYVIERSSLKGQRWIAKLETRNKDILALVTACFLILMLAFMLTDAVPLPDAMPLTDPGDATAEAIPRVAPMSLVVSDATFLLVQALAFLIFFLFLAYFLILQKSIISVLEYLSLVEDHPGDDDGSVGVE